MSLKLSLVNNFNAKLQKQYYKAPDKRDWHLIWYLNNFGSETTRFNDLWSE